jgi:alpha-glucosidase (family GH31 glycosyl hydrolase)
MPAGTWCDIFRTTEPCFTSLGQTYELPSKAADAHVHIRQGSIVPLQDVPTANTTADLQKEPVDFHVLGEVIDTTTGTWTASGVYYNDDGVTLNITGRYNSYSLSASRKPESDSSNETITFKIYVISQAD